MFTGIKDKLLNVRKNVGLFKNDDTTNKSKEKPKYNEFSGARLLNHFQSHWVEIHNLNEYNAKAAENVAATVDTISNTVRTSKENLDLLTHILTNSNLMTNITQCLNQVTKLYSASENLEQKLNELEDIIDEVEFQKMKTQHQYHLKNYKDKKQETLDNLKISMEDEYKQKVEEHENSKKTILEERQKVFQEAFRSDLEVYKSLGTIPKVDLSRNQNGAILEEIQLDFDQNELETFFNDENNYTS